MTSLHTRSAPGPAADVPPATRASSPGWRDPRIILGVVIVAACVLLGARVLAQADDTVQVWSARRDLPAGTVLDRADLSAVRVRLTTAVGDRYLPATSALAGGRTLTRDLVAGELLPRSALGAGSGRALVEVPLSVAPDDVPGSVRPGVVVDVWVTPRTPDPGATRPRARLVLEDVAVVAVPAVGDSLAPTTTRQVIVGVEADRVDDVADALGATADGRVVLTRKGRR